MNPALWVVAVRQGGVVSRSQAERAGYTAEQIRERLADGRWERIRHGYYAERLDVSGLAVWDEQIVRHRRLVHAAMSAMRPGSAVVSHHSALILHGVPVWNADLSEVQLTRMRGYRSGVKAGVRHHRGLLEPADLSAVGELATTSLARALVETAGTTSFEAGVISADAVLRVPAAAAEVPRLLEVTEYWPGGPTIRAVAAFADPLAESVGESRLRVLIHNEGLPRPVLQAAFDDAGGFVARVDFYFPDECTVVEFDGLMKYADGSPTTLIREKHREDRLRALGLEVVRVTWSDLDHPGRTAMRIREAFARSRRTALAG